MSDTSNAVLRNQLKYGFLIGPAVNLVIKSLKAFGIEAQKGSATPVRNENHRTIKIQQAKVSLKGVPGCKNGYISDYDDSGIVPVSLSRMKIYDNTDQKDTLFFFISENDSTLYGVRVSNMRGITPEGINKWEWIMAGYDKKINTVIDYSGVDSSITLADAEKLKSIATLTISISADDLKEYHNKRIEYKLS